MLPPADGLCGGLAVREMTLFFSNPSELDDSTGPGTRWPFTPTQLGLQGSLQQLWVLTAAVRAYGPKNLMLPLPNSFVRPRPGPAEVSLRVLSFDNTRSPERLLTSPVYTDQAAGTHIQSGANHGWLVVRPTNSGADGVMNEYLLQGALGHRWIEIGVIGFHLTLGEARGVAKAATAWR